VTKVQAAIKGLVEEERHNLFEEKSRQIMGEPKVNLPEVDRLDTKEATTLTV
jgi:hypothetical protein